MQEIPLEMQSLKKIIIDRLPVIQAFQSQMMINRRMLQSVVIIDELALLVQKLIQHGSIDSLSEKQIEEIKHPISLNSLATLLTLVDEEIAAEMISWIDIDYVTRNIIMIDDHVKPALATCPMLFYSLAACQKFDKIVEGLFLFTVLAAPWWADRLLSDARANQYLNDPHTVVRIINALPQLAEKILSMPWIQKLIGDLFGFLCFVYLAPKWVNRVLQIAGVEAEDIIKIVENIRQVPLNFDKLFAHTAIGGLIKNSLDVIKIIEFNPALADILFRDARIWRLMNNCCELAKSVSESKYAKIVLMNPELCGVLQHEKCMSKFLVLANIPFDQLAQIPQLAGKFKKSWQYLAYCDDSKLIILNASMSESEHRVLSRIGFDVQSNFRRNLNQAIDHYESQSTFFSNLKQKIGKYNYPITMPVSAANLVELLLRCTTSIARFKEFYLFSYLLKKPHDIARVMCAVSIDREYDNSATLPAVNNNVLWPAGVQNVTNALLNQLLPYIEEVPYNYNIRKHPRPLLLQAHLLIEYAKELACEVAKCDSDELAVVMRVNKSHHDALNLLAKYYFYTVGQDKLIKTCLLQIQVAHENHILKSQNLENRVLRDVCRYSNAQLEEHLAQLLALLNTDTFTDIMPTRSQFQSQQLTKITAKLPHGTLWQRFIRENSLANSQSDESVLVTQVEQISATSRRLTDVSQ